MMLTSCFEWCFLVVLNDVAYLFWFMAVWLSSVLWLGSFPLNTEHINIPNTSLHRTHHYTEHINIPNTSLYRTLHYTEHINIPNTSLYRTHHYTEHIIIPNTSLQGANNTSLVITETWMFVNGVWLSCDHVNVLPFYWSNCTE